MGTIITTILAAIPAIEKIMGMVLRIFPPKSEQERGVEKYKKAIEKHKTENKKLREAIRKAKLGRTKKIEDILNN